MDQTTSKGSGKPDASKKRPGSSSGGGRPSPSLTSGVPGIGRNKARKLAQVIEKQTPSNEPNILRTLNAAKFADARAFEIRALGSVMLRAAEMSKSRAFQKVPRFLRRRAASHNPNKIPRRLRERAHKEIANDPVRPKKKKPKAVRRKPRSDFAARQERNGTWLETHLWHAKRFHMESMFGWKVPVAPTQKGARAMYRAAKYATVATDLSYLALYEFRGPVADIAKLVAEVTDPFGPRVGAARYTHGRRTVETALFANFPHDQLAPATFLWQAGHAAGDEVGSGRLWMWTHPLAEEQLIAALAKAMEHLAMTSVHVEQTTDVCRISLKGPKALALLHSVLDLAPSTSEPAKQVWEALCGTTDPSPLPVGAVLGLQAWDPRLSYPPRRPTYVVSQEARAAAQAVIESPWPTACAESTVWDASVRDASRASKKREHDLNERRRAQLVPGIRLTPDAAQDTQFPVLLFRTSDPVAGIDVILPRGWSLPLWRSLTWAGARPAGLNCLRSLHHEHLVPMYPYDFPLSDGHADVIRAAAEVQQSKWRARPPGKRVNYESLGIAHPFDPDWAGLVSHGWLVSPAVASRVLGDVTRGEWSLMCTALAAAHAKLDPTTAGTPLCHVALEFPGRGNASEHALVYSMRDANEVGEWGRVVRTGAWDEAANKGMNAAPPASRVVGYVTSGRFSLAIGRARVIAVVRVQEILGQKWVLPAQQQGVDFSALDRFIVYPEHDRIDTDAKRQHIVKLIAKKRAGRTAMSIEEIVKNDADDDAAGSDGNAAVTPTNPLPPVTIAKPSKRKASGSKASSGKASGGKATFCSASTNFLLDHFCNLADDGVLGDSNTLKAQHRVSIAQALSDEFNMQFTAEQVKNRVTYLRTCFRAVKRLLSYSGNGCTWNEGECTVDVPEEFWNDLSAELKEELTAGCKPFPYYKKANMLWGSSTATGEYSHLKQDGKESGDVEGVDGQDDAAPASKRSRTSDSSSRRLSDSEFLMGIKEVFQSVATADSKPALTAALEWVQDAYNDNEEYQIDVATRLTEDQALRVMAVSESKRKRVLDFFIQ
ncbi:Ribonucleases P/MRP protein subunit pop1 [Blastocladiella emersonii ATCC 22665]|nr:Ribonucleases P/MRP protein subunit pop1 [Blastocladiella emersonii ATCC 22665]